MRRLHPLPHRPASRVRPGAGAANHRGAVYSGTLAVTAIFFTVLCWLYAANNYRLVDRGLSPALLRSMTLRYVIGMALYILAFALAFVSVVVTILLIVALAPLFVLPEPGERFHKNPPRGEGKVTEGEEQPEKPDGP